MSWVKGSIGIFCLHIAAGTCSLKVLAQDADPVSRPAILEETTRLLARINLHSEDELSQFLDKAEALHQQKQSYHISHPIAVVLHGPEVGLFTFENYRQNKRLVDKAAQLDALGVIDVKMCETYMRSHGIGLDDVPPYVDVVPYGPALESELKQQGYVEF